MYASFNSIKAREYCVGTMALGSTPKVENGIFSFFPYPFPFHSLVSSLPWETNVLNYIFAMKDHFVP